MRIDPLNQGSQATFQNIPLNTKKIKHWRMATVISQIVSNKFQKIVRLL